MANDVIDTLSLEINSSAKNADKAIDNLINRLNGLSNAVDKFKTGNFNGLKNIGENFKGVNQGIKKIEDAAKKSVKFSATLDSAQVEKSLSELRNRFKDAGKGFVFSGNTEEAQKQIESLEKRLSSLRERESKGIALGKINTSSFASLEYDISLATNKLDILRKSLENVTKSVPKINLSIDDDKVIERIDSLRTRFKDLGQEFVFTGNADQFYSTFSQVEEKLNSLFLKENQMVYFGEIDTSEFEDLEKEISKTLNMYETLEQKSKEFASMTKTISISPNALNYDQSALTATFGEAARGIENWEQAVERFGDLAGVKLNNAASQIDNAGKRIVETENSIADAGNGIKAVDSAAGKTQGINRLGSAFSNLSSAGKDFKKALSGILSFIKKFYAGVGTLAKKLFDLRKGMSGVLSANNKNNISFNKGLNTVLKYGFGIRSLYFLFRRLRSAITEGFEHLAQYSSEVNASISSISSALLRFKNALSVAFAPIVNVVAPYITAFINMISDALNAVGRFFSTLTGKKFAPQATKVYKDYAQGLTNSGNAADKAADSQKKLNKQLELAPYDELNVLNRDNEDAGGAAGIGGGIGDIADGAEKIEDMFDTVGAANEWAKKLRDAFLDKDWERLGSTLAKGLNKGLKKVYDALDWKKVGKKITGFTDGVTRTFNSFVDNFDWDLLGRTIGQGINTGVNTLTQLIEGTDWKNLGRKFASGVNGLFDEVDWGNLGNLIGDKFMIAWNIFSGFVEDLDFAEVGRSFADLLSGAFEKINLSTIGTSLAKAINGAFKTLLNFTRNFKWDDLRKNVSNGINDTLKTLDWKKAGQSLNEFLSDLGEFMLGVAEDVDWEAFGKGIGDFLSQIDWKTHFLNFLSILKEVLGGIWSGLGDTSAGKFVQGIIAFKIGTKLMPFVNGIVKFFVSQAVIKKLSGGFQKMFGDSISEGATEAGKNIQGKDLFNKLKINSTLFNAGLSNMFTEDVSRILKGESVAEEGNREMAINLVSGAANKAGKESGISWLDRVQISNSWRNFLTGEIPSLEEALDKIITKYTEAGGSVDALKTQITTALSENKTISQEYATAIEEYIGGTGDTFTTAATEYETASAQMQTATSGISGMLQSISDNSWGADQQLSLVAGALQSLSDKGLLSNPQLSTLNEMLLNAQNSGGGLAPILQNLSDELYNAGINAPTFFDALKDGSYYVGDKLPSDFSTFIGSLQNVKTEADNASTATSNVGTTANNSVTNLLSFISQAALMAIGLGNIKTGSENAGAKISELSGTIVDFANGLATNAQTVFDEGKKTGENYPAGLVEGINGKKQDVTDASGDLADAATDSVKNKWQENSPSKVAEGLGENYGQGLINGIKAKINDLGTAMDSVIDKLEKPFDNLAQNFQTVGKNLMVSLQNGINSQKISLPRISVSWTKYFMGNSQFSIPNFSLSYLAKGGLITDEMLAVMGENRRKEAVLPLENQKTMSMIADAIVDRMPQRLDIGNIEINRSQAPYVTTANIPRSTYSDSFGDDMRRDIAAISSNTFNNNTNIGQAVKEALNGMAVVADGYIIGYLQSKNMESRNQNGGLGIFEV